MSAARHFLIYAGIALFCISNANGENIVVLSKSPVWQVRYCVAIRFDSPTTEAREALERLCRDEVPQVRFHAFSAYSRLFVNLEPDIVKNAFVSGHFDVSGVTVTSRKIFETAEYWIHELKSSTNDTTRARAVEALGLCGTAADIGNLPMVSSSRNAHLLMELAVASKRLGNQEVYLQAINTVLAQPVSQSLHYQIKAIDCLIQTHPEQARSVWEDVHRRFKEAKDVQPGWVYSHVVQGERLP